MDPLTTAIMTVLGKFAVDKGAGIAKEVGDAAAKAAGQLFDKVMGKLKDDQRFSWLTDLFDKDPKTYEAPVAKAVEEQVKADPNFAAELDKLVEQFKQAGGASLVASNVSVNASNNSNAIGVVQAGGNVGPITMGNTTNNRSGGVDISPSGGSVTISGDVVGRDKKTK
jgi:hypothetical protein